MDLIIERLNGDSYSFIDNGISIIDFTVHSPVAKNNIDEIEGRDGHIDLGTTYEGRTLSGVFLMQAVDVPDYPLLRNEVFKILDSRELFYLISTDEPGKRWRVKVSGGYSPQQIKKFGKFSLTFISDSAYSESIGTTLDPFTFDNEYWQVGQGLIEEITEIKDAPATWFDIGYKKWSEI